MKGVKLALGGIVVWIATTIGAVSCPPDKAAVKTEPFTVTDTEVKLPGITIDRLTHEVRIEATVCLDSGILEYVVCQPNTFDHEAIFTTQARPELLHAALLLARLKTTPQLRGMTNIWWEKALKNDDSRVKIEVELKDKKGAKKRINLTSMLRNRQDTNAEATKVQDAWVFAGSFMHTNQENGAKVYAANLSGILVGIWPDPSTVIQYGVANGNPYEGKNQGIEINEELVPEVGTKVTLVFSRYKPLEKPPVEKPKPLRK